MVTQVIDQVPRVQYTATAGQPVFAYNFQIFVKGDITVEQNGTPLTVDVDFTVSGVGTTTGGNITLLSGATSGDIMTIYRSQNFDRETDYQDSGDFLAGTINDDINRIILMLQQNREEHTRELQYQIDDTISERNIPLLAARLGKLLGFDSSGNLNVQSLSDSSSSDAEIAAAVDNHLNITRYELGSTAAAASHTGISAGHILETNFRDSNRVTGSASRVKFTGTTISARIGGAALINFPFTDGLFYDQLGQQFDEMEMLFPEQFGARRNGSTDDSAAINNCWAYASDNQRPTELLDGVYKVDSTLYATTKGTTFQTCNITGAGMGYDSGSSRMTLIDGSSLVADPVIIVQLGRGFYLGKFNIKGANGAYTIDREDYEYVNSAYVKAGVQDFQYAPMCGIAIDGGVGPTPPGDGGWANVTYRGTSSGSLSGVIEEVTVRECVLGFAHCIEDLAANGNQFNYTNCKARDCKVGWAGGSTQARVLSIDNMNFDNFRTAISTQDYGRKLGNNPSVRDCEFATGFEMVSMHHATSFTMSTSRAESVHRIGQSGTGGASAARTVNFIGCEFQLLSNADGKRSPILFESSAAVQFIGGGLEEGGTQANSAPFNFLGSPCLFEGFYFEVPNANNYVIEGGKDLLGIIDHRNTTINPDGNEFILGATGNLGAISGNRVRDIPGTLGFREGIKLVYTPFDFNKYENISNCTSFVFSATELTFNCSDVTFLQVGDYLYWLMDIVGRSANQQQIATLKVTAISAPAVTCSLLFARHYYDETDTPSNIPLHINGWAPRVALTGDIASNTTISNVSPTDILVNGDWLQGAEFDNNTRVVSGGGTATVVINKAANKTETGVPLYFDQLKEFDLTSLVYPIATLEDSATPNLKAHATSGNTEVYVTGGTTPITDLDNGYTGKKVKIIFEHAVTIVHGTNFFLDGGVDFVGAIKDTIELVQKADTFWYQTGGSINSAISTRVLTKSVTLTTSQVNNCRATPIELVPAPGAGKLIEFVSALLFYNFTSTAFTVGADEDFVIQYDASTDVTASVESTGFIDQTNDEIRLIEPTWVITADLVALVNKKLEFFNDGSGETADGGTSTLRVNVSYRIHNTGL